MVKLHANFQMRSKCWFLLFIASTAMVNPGKTLAQDYEIRYPDAALAIDKDHAGVLDVTRPPTGLPLLIRGSDGIMRNESGDMDITAELNTYFEETASVIGPSGGRGGKQIIYLPDGEYRVSGTLHRIIAEKHQCFFLFGQSREGTIIKLQDHHPDYQDRDHPKPVIDLSNVTGVGNNNQDVFIKNVTVDVGSGNEGAIGIDWLGNNANGVENLTIRSSGPDPVGRTGFRTTFGAAGGGIGRYVHIDGFDVGIEIGGLPGYCFEYVFLENIRESGILLTEAQGTLRKVSFHTEYSDVPAIRVVAGGSSTDINYGPMLSLFDSDFSGAGGSAVELGKDCFAFVRNVSSNHFDCLISKEGTCVETGSSLEGEYVSTAVYANSFDDQHLESLNLPVEEVPFLPWDPPEQWVNVMDYGAIPDDNESNKDEAATDSKAIQDAIDATGDPTSPDFGKTTLYFPRGMYIVDDIIRLRYSIQRVNLMWARFGYPDEFTDPSGTFFSVDPGLYDTIFIEQYGYGRKPGRGFLTLNSSRTVVMKDIAASELLFKNTPAADGGRVFMVCCLGAGNAYHATILDKGVSLYARWLNSEVSRNPNDYHLHLNRGGIYWVLCTKIGEQANRAANVLTSQGGKTEFLGGIVNRSSSMDALSCGDAGPMFRTVNSWFSFAGIERPRGSSSSGLSNEIILEETRGDITRSLQRSTLPVRNNALMECGYKPRVLSLIVANPGQPVFVDKPFPATGTDICLFRLYPNPADGYFVIENGPSLTPSNEFMITDPEQLDVDVLDITGRPFISKHGITTGERIELHGRKGVYLVCIRSFYGYREIRKLVVL